MKILTLIFTYNTTLLDWQTNGTLERELSIYTKLLNYFDKIYFITYDTRDKHLQGILPNNIIVLPKKYNVHNFFYSLLIPLAYKKEITASMWIKTNQITSGWTALLIKLFFRKKINVRTGYTESLFSINRNVFNKQFIQSLEWLSYKFADFSTVTSNHQLKYLKNKYSAKNIYVIPNGIDTDIFTPIIKTKPRVDNSIHLLSIGRLHEEKNFVNLLKSLRSLHDIQLTIIGTGKLKNTLISLQKKYNLHVTFIDRVSNTKLPPIYNEADIYIQPSLHEGNPKTILEAMSCGMPVIATNINGINNIIQHKKTGYLCNIHIQSIKNAIIALSNDTKAQKKLGENARKYILQNYNLKTIIDKEINLYKRY